MNRIAPVALAIVLLGGGTLAVASSGGTIGTGGNAAVTQYEPPPPVYYPPTYQPPAGGEGQLPAEGGQGVKGTHAGGNANNNVENGDGEQFVATETASTGPAGGAEGLPFTGLDLLALAGLGVLFILLGLGQARLGRTRR